jgi:uncharacterized protein involved in outer membrane biogenesis
MKRALKIIGWTLFSVVMLVIVVVLITIYLVFTPARLTPIARQIAAQYVTCEHEIGEVDLTFFSTFPYFGASIKDVTLINPMSGAQNDTLASVPELLVSVKLLDAINGDIYIKRFKLKDATANVYIAADGSTNFDVFALPADTIEEEKDTTGGWRLNSVGWDENLTISAHTLSFVDEKDTISASLHNAAITLAGLEKDTIAGAQLDLSAEQVCASLKGEQYANNLNLSIHLPALWNDLKHVYIDGTKLQINEFAIKLDGEVGAPCLSSGIYNMDVTLKTGKWQIKPLLALVPEKFTKSLKDLDVDGQIQLDATAKGTYSESSMPLITAQLTLKDGEGAYKPLPYTLRDMQLEADADLNLNKGQVSNVAIKHLSAKTKETQLSAKGKVNDLLGDMLIDLQMDLDANLPDFAYFLPKNMTLTGRTKGQASAKIHLNDLTAMNLHKGKISADMDLKDILFSMDSMKADMPYTHAVIQMPNPKPSKPKVNWARIDLETDKVDFEMALPLSAKLKKSAIQLEAGNVLSKDPVLYAAVGLQSERPLAVVMDSMGGFIDAPKMYAYADYNTKDTVGLHHAKASLQCDGLDGNFKDIKATLNESQLEASMSAGKRISAKIKTSDLYTQMGDELKAKAQSLAVEASARYNKREENALLKWNPRLKIDLKQGEFDLPERLPETVFIPSIEFSYSNREMNIDNSRIELGNSDLNLKGNVKNIGKWFRHQDILVGTLDIVSNHCDANQLLAWFSADSGSEEEPAADSQEPTANSQQTTEESEPFLVPTDVDLALKTNMQEVEIFNQVAKDLKGGLYVKNGTLILDEIGFVCRAAKLQLTAMYRTPRRNHLYLGLDYHMIDIDIDELMSMIPNLEEMVPMLSSFKGAAEFHLAAETYLNSQYQPKMSTLRGAASLTGKDLVVLDGETFDQIAKLLMFKKKTENKIDSINAELTIYKNEIDLYPLCVQMDNYMVALGGRHNTDMTFDYDINVLSPIYLGVNVSGNIDDLKIKLAKCKFAQDFKPHWYQKTDTQSKELRERIKQSMEKNVRIK